MNCRKECNNFPTCRFVEEGERAAQCNFFIPNKSHEKSEADVRLNNLLNARKLKAFDWLAANADDISIEWTGTHNHIYSGSDENLERLGCGRSLLEAVENCLGI